jgi:hypothetical protein
MPTDSTCLGNKSVTHCLGMFYRISCTYEQMKSETINCIKKNWGYFNMFLCFGLQYDKHRMLSEHTEKSILLVCCSTDIRKAMQGLSTTQEEKTGSWRRNYCSWCWENAILPEDRITAARSHSGRPSHGNIRAI